MFFTITVEGVLDLEKMEDLESQLRQTMRSHGVEILRLSTVASREAPEKQESIVAPKEPVDKHQIEEKRSEITRLGQQIQARQLLLALPIMRTNAPTRHCKVCGVQLVYNDQSPHQWGGLKKCDSCKHITPTTVKYCTRCGKRREQGRDTWWNYDACRACEDEKPPIEVHVSMLRDAYHRDQPLQDLVNEKCEAEIALKNLIWQEANPDK